MEPLFAGVDAGTSGIRAIMADASGRVHARASTALRAAVSEDMHLQNPEEWWESVGTTIRAALGQLRNFHALRAIAIDGTSGTLVCADNNGNPVGQAIMYNDARARPEATHLQAASSWASMSWSWALPKAVWIKNHEPERFARTRYFLNQADWIAGRLCGSFGITDYSNGLKMGLDLEAQRWPAWIDPDIRSLLPLTVAPGTQIGAVTRQASRFTGLPYGLPVITGATDGVAAGLASGLHRIGDYSTSLGSTLTFKALAAAPITHPLVYAHKLPGGMWLPGAASNVGAGWIRAWFADQDVQRLDRHAIQLLPGAQAVYPLIGRGERFPFADDSFSVPIPEGLKGTELFAAGLLGTACVERRCYEVLDNACGTGGGEVYSTGGGSRSDIWMQLRADVCRRPFHRPACPAAAMGAAILAAAGTHFDSVQSASKRMTRLRRSFCPGPSLEDHYRQFLRDYPRLRG